MTPFRLILNSSGLSIREAAVYLNVSHNTAESWAGGRRSVPAGVMAEMFSLIDRQERAAREAVDVITGMAAQRPDMEAIDIGFCADDFEAQSLGWPCKTAHDAVIRRVLEGLPPELRPLVQLVPRGSTLTTAGAADAHGH